MLIMLSILWLWAQAYFEFKCLHKPLRLQLELALESLRLVVYKDRHMGNPSPTPSIILQCSSSYG